MHSYTFHINLYDLASLGTIFIGLNFALLLWFTKSINRTANRFLALALVTMILWMMRILAIDIQLETYLPHWDRLPMQFLFALGPLIYFYVRKLTRPEYKLRWKDLLHFSPILLEQCALALEIKEGIRTGTATYATPIFQQLNPVLQLLIFISIITYLYQSYRLIQNFYRRLQPVLMDRSLLEFRWLRRLLAATALLWLLWIAYAAVDYFGYRNQLGVHLYYPFYIFFAVIIIWTAMAAFLKPRAGMMIQSQPAIKPSPAAELREKGAWLKKAMETNLYYQDPELSINSLAEKLGLSSRELSQIINTALRKNFNDFINEYRVRDVARKMQDSAYDHITLLGIAYEAGFNSKSTFNRILKQMTGKSPVEYKLALKKEFPSRDLGRQPRFVAIISNQETTHKWSDKKLNHNYMFRNYLKIAWRNITRNKAFSFINIFGLGLGMACSLLIILWVQDERNVDAFHVNRANIYSVYERVFSEGKVEAGRATPGLLATELKRAIPEIKYASGYWEDEEETLFSVGDKNFSNMGTYADTDFFKMFSYPLLQGTAANALAAPDDIAISRSMATKIFGSPQAAMGKAIKFNNAHFFTVNAVFEDLPANTSQHFDFVINWQYLLKAVDWLSNWANRRPQTYIQLQPGADAARVDAKIKNFVTTYLTATYRTGYRVELGLQSLNEVYLKSIFKQGKPDGGRIEYVRLFTMVALFILIIACVNFMNLATARSVKRAKEVGIRKTIGAIRSRLIVQFIGEAMLLTFFAIVIALILALCVMPYFNQLTGKHIVLPFNELSFWLDIGGLLLATGFIAGGYPAFFLSSLNPVVVLKGALKFSPNALLFRKGLVVFQFVLSIVLIIGTLVISQQLRYIQTKNLGFDRGNLVYMHFPYPQGLPKGFEVFKHELSVMPGIKAVDFSAQPPSHTNNYTYDLNWPGKNPGTKAFAIRNWVGYDYFALMGIHFVEGRAFSKNFTTDTTGIIINETALKMMDLKSPLGQLVTIGDRRRTILGVVKDFHFKSLHEPIEPLIMYLDPNPDWGYLLVKTEAGKTRQGVASMESVFTQLEKKFPFRCSFADEEYQKLYNDEMTVGKLSDSFSFLAIFISCLGLLGLTMFTVEQRRKEIGVRKIIGASEIGIVTMLSKDIVKLVILSAIIATPVAWLAMNNWLQNFAYRVSLNGWIFLVAGLIAILIALATVSYQAIKAAVANPVKSLRTE
ncbi:MAG TPA: ABC transporter permease [Mucilaginibacter sp.]